MERCLNSVSDLVDEIVIVDTGSEDRTRDIARAFTQKLYELPWNDDFADSQKRVFRKSGNGILYVAGCGRCNSGKGSAAISGNEREAVPEKKIL